MRKLLALLMSVLVSVPAMLSQTTFTGVVVDKDGNPLPGVKLEIPGTPDRTVSDLDGTFTITMSDPNKKKLLATYAGMSPRKVKLKDGMKIKMKEYNWWTQKPDEWSWLAEAIFALPNKKDGDESCFNPAYGLMLGRVKKFGYYVKGVTNTFGNPTASYSESGGFIKKQKTTYWSVTGGGIVRLGCPIHLYAGVGYAEYGYYLQNMSGEWFSYEHRNKKNLVVDFGFMLRIKKITLSLGSTISPRTSYGPDDEYHDVKAAGNFGIGYTF